MGISYQERYRKWLWISSLNWGVNTCSLGSKLHRYLLRNAKMGTVSRHVSWLLIFIFISGQLSYPCTWRWKTTKQLLFLAGGVWPVSKPQLNMINILIISLDSCGNLCIPWETEKCYRQAGTLSGEARQAIFRKLFSFFPSHAESAVWLERKFVSLGVAGTGSKQRSFHDVS